MAQNSEKREDIQKGFKIYEDRPDASFLARGLYRLIVITVSDNLLSSSGMKNLTGYHIQIHIHIYNPKMRIL